ncbi:MAG: (2Fe-2S)-binding protein [Candidatus Nanohaloarchaea archaeon]
MYAGFLQDLFACLLRDLPGNCCFRFKLPGSDRCEVRVSFHNHVS